MTDRRIALIGPSDAFPGGIAQHTSELAARLDEAGLLTEHASWGRQFPRGFRPGGNDAFVSGGQPTREGLESKVTHDLHWDRPASWFRTGRRLSRVANRLIVVVSSPLQLPAIRILASSFRGFSRGSKADRDVVLIIHNVLPHEPTRLDRLVMRRVLRVADRTVVHSASEAGLARELGAQEVSSVRLPFHPPEGLRAGPHPAGDRRLDTLGFLGFVRPYKGLDLLLEALALAEAQPRLIVQGEFWEPVQQYEQMITDLDLVGRVELRPGYASGSEMSDVLGAIDALVLPYRSATGSQQPRIAFACGVPVIATAVGDFPEQITVGRDGLVVDRPTASAIAEGIDRFYAEGCAARLRATVTSFNGNNEWAGYVAELAASAGQIGREQQDDAP